MGSNVTSRIGNRHCSNVLFYSFYFIFLPNAAMCFYGFVGLLSLTGELLEGAVSVLVRV